MGRRASSSLNGPAIAGIVVVLLILLGAGAILLRGKKDTFTGTPLPIEDIYSGANSLRGNEYTVEGTIDSREPRDSGLGITLLVDSDGSEEPVFIVVPPDVATINIERNSRYSFKVRVGEGGIPIATGVKRL